MEESEKPCPRCGGKTNEGHIVFNYTSNGSQAIDHLVPEFNMSSATRAALTETITSEPIWAEKTGEKKGFIFKKEEVIKLRIKGYRCIECNHIELFSL